MTPSISSSTEPFSVLLYSRVSDPRQAAYGHSIHTQPEDLTAWAEAQSWRVLGHISDPGRSGRTAQRQGYTALMDLVRELRPDAVVVTRISRFMRNLRLTLNAVHELREIGVALICKDEPVNTRQRGVADMLLAILATMAEWESERLSEYAIATRKGFIAQGRWPGGKPPYGYRLDKTTGELVMVEDEAQVVQLQYDLYTRGGIGIGAIVKELFARAIRSPTGKSIWGISVVSAILKNPIYAGKHALGMRAPPIVTQAVFDRAQAVWKSNRTVHPPRVDPWPLQNLLRCAYCGDRFRSWYSRGKRRFYRCKSRASSSSYYLHHGEPCPARSLDAEEIEQEILYSLEEALSKPANFRVALVTSIEDLRARLVDLERDFEPVLRELDQVEEELRRLTVDWVRTRLGDARLDQMQRAALEREEYLQARLEALGPGQVEELERTRALLAAVEEDLDEGDADGGWKVYTRLLPSGLVDHTGDLPSPRVAVYDVGDVLRELLNKLRAEVWVTAEGLQVKGLIEVSVGAQASCYGS